MNEKSYTITYKGEDIAVTRNLKTTLILSDMEKELGENPSPNETLIFLIFALIKGNSRGLKIDYEQFTMSIDAGKEFSDILEQGTAAMENLFYIDPEQEKEAVEPGK